MYQYRDQNRSHGQDTIFIRPYHVKEEDKTILDEEMKRLSYLGILREGFWPRLAQ